MTPQAAPVEADEQAYFGPIYYHVMQLRAAINSGHFDDADRLIDLVSEQYIIDRGDFAMLAPNGQPWPIFEDLKNNVHKAVNAAFPEASAVFRQKLIDGLPEAIAEKETEFNKQVAEAAKAGAAGN